MKGRASIRGLTGLLPLALALAAWQFAGAAGSAAFPPPLSWWAAVVILAKSGVLFSALAATLGVVLVSLAVATIAGFGIGLLIGALPVVRQCASPVLEYLRVLPPPVLIPLAVLLLGYSGAMKLAVVAFAAFWPILLNTVAGVMQIRRLTFDVARGFRLTWPETLGKIIVPASLPALLLGLRVALPQTVVVALVVEMFTGEFGIGSLMIEAQRNFDAPGVFGLLVVTALMGFVLMAMFGSLERLALRHRPLAR